MHTITTQTIAQAKDHGARTCPIGRLIGLETTLQGRNMNAAARAVSDLSNALLRAHFALDTLAQDAAANNGTCRDQAAARAALNTYTLAVQGASAALAIHTDMAPQEAAA